MATILGERTLKDILDTCDLIFSKEEPLLPTLKFNDTGELIDYNQKAFDNWKKYGLVKMAETFANNLKQVKFLINCEENDEFRIHESTQRIHDALLTLGVDHEFEIYSDSKAKISPHALGIGYHLLPGIEYCLENLGE